MASKATRALNVLDSVEQHVVSGRRTLGSAASHARLMQSAFVLVLACLAFLSLVAGASVHALFSQGAERAVQPTFSEPRELQCATSAVHAHGGDGSLTRELGLVESEDPEDDAHLDALAPRPPVHLARVAHRAVSSRSTASAAWSREWLGSEALPRGPPSASC